MTSFDGRDGLDRSAGADAGQPSYGNSSWTTNVPDPIRPTYGGPGYNAYGQPSRGRTLKWMLPILAIQAVVVGGVFAVQHFETRKFAAIAEAAASPSESASANAASAVVSYAITAGGRHNTAQLNYTGQDGTMVRRSDIRLPWRLRFRADAEHPPLVLNAQRTGGGDAGPVTCTITVGGTVVSTTTTTGAYASVLCNDS